MTTITPYDLHVTDARPRIATSAVVLLAHGSPDARHARDVEHLASRVRDELAGRPGSTVATAYLDHHDPAAAAVARRLSERGVDHVRVVPLLLSTAFHARVDVPAAVAAMRRTAPDLDIEATRPLGPDRAIAAACAELVSAAGYEPSQSTGLLVLAAGSKDPAAVAGFERDILTETLPGRALASWAGVRVAHLEGGRGVLDTAVLLRHLDRAERILAVTAVVADGALRDRMASLVAHADVDLVPGALADTRALAQIAVHRALE